MKGDVKLQVRMDKQDGTENTKTLVYLSKDQIFN